MKLGIAFNMYENAYSRYGSEKFQKLAEHGFSAADYGMVNTETSDIFSMSPTELEKKMLSEKALAKQAGIEISQVHGPWRFPPQDTTDEQRRERMDKMKTSIIATQLLGCKNWVVHPIMPFGIEDLKSGNAQKTWELNIEFMSELLDFAKKHDVTVCLENMPFTQFSIATPERILKFVNKMNDESFKICLDTGHVAVFPDLKSDECIKTLGNQIRVLHVHDNMGDNDSHLYPTNGIINWQNTVNALREINFDGSFSLETLPSDKLSDDEFNAECIKLNQTAKNILNS